MTSKEKILHTAIILFAEKGYSGLSMRMLATAVDMSVATIYHHFPDKNTLYLEAVRFAFSGKELVFSQVWEADLPPAEKLSQFVHSLVLVIYADSDFQRLMQREIMEANPERMQLLAQSVFQQQFRLLMQFAAELAPNMDAHLVATSIIGLVKNHFDHQPLHRYFPGWLPTHQQPEIIAKHVTTLLLNGLNPVVEQ